MRGLELEHTPAGAGAGRVLISWQQLARHADAPCEQCLPVVLAVRRRSKAPPELLSSLCGDGETLARTWLEACLDLVEHLIALQ